MMHGQKNIKPCELTWKFKSAIYFTIRAVLRKADVTHHVKWYIMTDVSAAIRSLETSVTVYQSKHRGISEDWKRRFYKRLLCRGHH